MATQHNFRVKNGLEVGGQEVISSSGVVTSAALGGQTLASGDSPTFNNLTLTNDIAVGGDLNLTGDLNITGDVNSLSVTDLDVTDQTITLGAGQVESASGGSGIVIGGSNASLLWNETTDVFDINKGISITGTTLVSDDQTNDWVKQSVSGTTSALTFGNTESTSGQAKWEYTRSDGRFKGYIGANAVNNFMSITSSGQIGIGTDSPDADLHISSATGTELHIQEETAGQAATLKLTNTQNSFVVGADANPQMFFINTDGNQGAGLCIDTSHNVGIGTSSPSRELELSAANPRFRITDTDGGYSEISGNSGHLSFSADTGNSQAGTRITFDIDGDEKVRIDSSGNVGIGVTPAAHSSLFKAIDIDNTSLTAFNDIVGIWEANTYYDGSNYRYRADGYAQQLLINNGGSFQVKQAVSGTAGANVSLSENLTLDPLGKLGIKASTPSSRLELGTLPDDDWITFEQSGRKNALGGYFSSTDSGTLWKIKMTTGNTNGSMNEIYRLTSAGTFNFMQNSAKLPLVFHGTGTGTYDQTAIYTGQSNSSGNKTNGMFIEMGRLTSSSNAEVRAFVVAARGGQASFKVLENSAGITQDDGDYLARMYESGADGFLALYTGQAAPLEQTRISSYGQSFINKTAVGQTSTNKTILSVGSDEQSAAGTFHVSDGDNANGGIRQSTHSSRVYTNVSSIYTQVSANRYWHIKTNIQSPNNIMYIVRVHGYSYGDSGHIIDIQRSGYAYSSHGLHTNTQSANNGSSTSHTLVHYFASDNYLCFRCDAGGGYFTGLSMDIKFQSPTGYNWNYRTIEHQINSNSGSYY